MFTGIIEGFGTVANIVMSEQKMRLTIDADFDLDHTKVGDSIAVNGACLTAVTLSGNRFTADVSPETLSVSCLDQLKTRDRVNLERALRLSDRLDGHLVSGHVDGVGVLKTREKLGNAIIIRFDITEHLARYIIKKGSVAVDGVSLTINDCDNNGFSVSIIPHTAKLTTVGIKKAGDPVNIETDVIGKYVEQFVLHPKKEGDQTSQNKPLLDMNFLQKTGFL